MTVGSFRSRLFAFLEHIDSETQATRATARNLAIELSSMGGSLANLPPKQRVDMAQDGLERALTSALSDYEWAPAISDSGNGDFRYTYKRSDGRIATGTGPTRLAALSDVWVHASEFWPLKSETPQPQTAKAENVDATPDDSVKVSGTEAATAEAANLAIAKGADDLMWAITHALSANGWVPTEEPDVEVEANYAYAHSSGAVVNGTGPNAFVAMYQVWNNARNRVVSAQIGDHLAVRDIDDNDTEQDKLDKAQLTKGTAYVVTGVITAGQIGNIYVNLRENPRYNWPLKLFKKFEE